MLPCIAASISIPDGAAPDAPRSEPLGDAVAPLIWKIRALVKKVGLAVNPPTNIALADDVNFREKQHYRWLYYPKPGGLTGLLSVLEQP